ncbi:MAG: hypothetical protein ACLQVX_20295 [Limisphaerales bacterium]
MNRSTKAGGRRIKADGRGTKGIKRRAFALGARRRRTGAWEPAWSRGEAPASPDLDLLTPGSGLRFSTFDLRPSDLGLLTLGGDEEVISVVASVQRCSRMGGILEYGRAAVN